MNRNNFKTAFPGTRRGIVRVFIKRTTQEDSAQLQFHFPIEEPQKDD
ncbi:hypothetical protein M4D71_20700 [Niallia taxi]|nr:hypothetical protein [Niallia taxi]MCT2346576.1 hypothetical protein [Niallia taxi]